MLNKKALSAAPAAVVKYVDDVFSTTTYTGAGTSQTVTNNIDLATEGGMVWIKNRDAAVASRVYDTNRGAYKEIYTSATNAETDRTGITAGISSFNTNGFSLGSNDYNGTNQNTINYVSWTFRQAEKFFDVVTYTGDGTGGSRQLSHNLGSTPGCVIIKRRNSSSNWMAFHRGNGGSSSAYAELSLNLVTAPASGGVFSQTIVTSTYFVPGDIQDADGVTTANVNGATYVAYLFAHDAGGFGTSGSDNIISCGEYTGNGSSTGPTVTLGYEPQWLLIKRTDTQQSWLVYDNVRDNSNPRTYVLYPDLTDAEQTAAPGIDFTSTGFQPKSTSSNINSNNGKYIYIAVRKNMK